MKRDEQFRRNHELFGLFMQEALRSDELRDEIPNKANLIFLPDNDPELRDANLALADKLRSQGKKPVMVKISYVAKTMTVLVPQIEVLSPV